MAKEFDLVDEMMWEDLVEFETLEEAGLENPPEFDCAGIELAQDHLDKQKSPDRKIPEVS